MQLAHTIPWTHRTEVCHKLHRAIMAYFDHLEEHGPTDSPPLQPEECKRAIETLCALTAPTETKHLTSILSRLLSLPTPPYHHPWFLYKLFVRLSHIGATLPVEQIETLLALPVASHGLFSWADWAALCPHEHIPRLFTARIDQCPRQEFEHILSKLCTEKDREYLLVLFSPILSRFLREASATCAVDRKFAADWNQIPQVRQKELCMFLTHPEAFHSWEKKPLLELSDLHRYPHRIQEHKHSFAFYLLDLLAIYQSEDALLEAISTRLRTLTEHQQDRDRQIQTLQLRKQQQKPVLVTITTRAKGGFSAQVGTTQAFLPASQLQQAPMTPKIRQQWIGRSVVCSILSIKTKLYSTNLVVSHRAWLEDPHYTPDFVPEPLPSVPKPTTLDCLSRAFEILEQLGAEHRTLTPILESKTTHPAALAKMFNTWHFISPEKAQDWALSQPTIFLTPIHRCRIKSYTFGAWTDARHKDMRRALHRETEPRLRERALRILHQRADASRRLEEEIRCWAQITPNDKTYRSKIEALALLVRHWDDASAADQLHALAFENNNANRAAQAWSALVHTNPHNYSDQLREILLGKHAQTFGDYAWDVAREAHHIMVDHDHTDQRALFLRTALTPRLLFPDLDILHAPTHLS